MESEDRIVYWLHIAIVLSCLALTATAFIDPPSRPNVLPASSMLISIPLLVAFVALGRIALRSEERKFAWLRDNLRTSFFAGLGVATANAILNRKTPIVIPFSLLWTASIPLPFLYMWRLRSLRRKSNAT